MGSSFKHSSAYLEDMKLRVLPRLLAAGTEAMQEAALREDFMFAHPGELRDYYLPGETTNADDISAGGSRVARITAYRARVRVSTLRNVWKDSVSRSSLAPIREPIILEGWSDEVEQWAKSIDGSTGRRLSQWMLSILEEQGVDGIHFALIDLPRVLDKDGRPLKRSVGDDDRAGLRPYGISLCAADVDPRGISIIGGQVVLTSCGVYLTDTAQGDDATDEEAKTAMWRQYRLTAERKVETRDFPLKEAKRDAPIDEEKVGEWIPVTPLGGGTTLDLIPVVPYYGNFSTGPYRGAPRFLEPAHVAAGTWRKRSEKDAQGRLMRDRIFQSGLQLKDGKPDLSFGMDFLFSTDDKGSATGLYPTGAALEALRKDIEDDEGYIRAATRALSAERISGDVTATEVGLHAVEAGTYQEAVTIGNGASIRTTLAFFEVLGGVSTNGSTVAKILMNEKVKVNWAFKSARLLSDAFMERMHQLTLEDKFPTESLLALEEEAGNLPEDYDIKKALKGVPDPLDLLTDPLPEPEPEPEE